MGRPRGSYIGRLGWTDKQSLSRQQTDKNHIFHVGQIGCSSTLNLEQLEDCMTRSVTQVIVFRWMESIIETLQDMCKSALVWSWV